MIPRERGDHAEAMVSVAARLIGAVHDDGALAVAQVLAEVKPADVPVLLVVLAATCDPDRSMEDALAWVTWDERGRAIPGLSAVPHEPRGLITEPEPQRVAGPPHTWDERTVSDCHALMCRARVHSTDPSDVVIRGEREYQRRRSVRRRLDAKASR